MIRITEDIDRWYEEEQKKTLEIKRRFTSIVKMSEEANKEMDGATAVGNSPDSFLTLANIFEKSPSDRPAK
ncbi:MAG: hypothetical protein HZC44_00560 [Geobacter sp.]|nr:hypothetical protein [Geobacter sp.]